MPRLLALTLLLSLGCSAERRYQRILDRVDSPGAQLAVIEPTGIAWSGAAGEGAPGDAASGDTAFLIGSNTKVITTAVVLQLVDEGELALDDSAANWVPALDPSITIEDLLRHTSGLGEYFDHEQMTADDGAAMAEVWTPDALIALGTEVRDDGPQKTAVYANTNFVAAGLVVEAVEGQPFGAVADARIFEPLGMTRSGFIDAGDPIPDHIALGDGGKWDAATWVDPSVGWAAGSAYASASDLAVFYEAALGGELYSAALVDAQLDTVSADLGFEEDGVDTFYGLGLMDVRFGKNQVFGHLGMVEGSTSLALQDPDTGAISVLLTNSSEVDFLSPSLRALRVAGRQD